MYLPFVVTSYPQMLKCRRQIKKNRGKALLVLITLIAEYF